MNRQCKDVASRGTSPAARGYVARAYIRWILEPGTKPTLRRVIQRTQGNRYKE
jgi:hypothetical protein